MDADELIARGYARISNRYRMVARLDRPDWLEYIADQLNRTVKDLQKCNWVEDQYRRVYSKDKLELPSLAIYKRFPSSNDTLGYRP
jgi:hypothetical protein